MFALDMFIIKLISALPISIIKPIKGVSPSMPPYESAATWNCEETTHKHTLAEVSSSPPTPPGCNPAPAHCPPLVPVEPELVSPGCECPVPTSPVSPQQLCCLPDTPAVSDLAWSRWGNVSQVGRGGSAFSRRALAFVNSNKQTLTALLPSVLSVLQKTAAQ